MATIHLRTTFFPLAFLLFFFPARASLDGAEPQKVGWGTTELQVPPGTHHLRIFFPYLFPRVAGQAEIDVSPREGETVHVRYRAPWLVFLPGKIRVG
ncbi:MAG: hypothetical protein QOK31_1558 [Solirubrobacteraceae bacterium]|jgi:hypothetical protein|nr:hypothetical protein [Solirubrobacteraceae bacterium]